jgi:hypothetical protein
MDSVEIFSWGRVLCLASSLGVRKGTTPRVGPRLGCGCFAHGEEVSGSGRSPRLGAGRFGWAALGCTGVGEREWLLGRAQLPAGFRPTTNLVFKILFLFPNLFIICKLI